MKPPFARGGRALRTKPGEMNKTEALREAELAVMLSRGEIVAYRFHPFRLRIAEGNAYYTPDFMVIGADGIVTIEEVKGHWEEAGLVRLKVAAEVFPFRFVSLRKRAKKDGGGWDCKVFKGWSDPAVEV